MVVKSLKGLKTINTWASMNRGKKGWPKGRRRTDGERVRISRGVKKFYEKAKFYGISRPRKNLSYEEKIWALTKRPLFRSYNNFMIAKSLRKRTRLKELRFLNTIMKYTHKKPENMNQEDVHKWIANIEGNGFSSNYKSGLKTTVRSLFKFLDKSELVKFVKCHTEPSRERYVPLEEVKRVIESTPIHEEKVFFSLLWESCCRVGEILNLTKDDIMVEKDVLYLRITNAKNSHSNRFVPILPKGKMYPLGSFSLLLKFMDRKKNRKMLWSWENVKQADYLFRKARKRLGIEGLHPHIFRKSRATWLDQHGLSLKQLCTYGGWSVNSKVMLETYVLYNYKDLVEILKMRNINHVKERWN